MKPAILMKVLEIADTVGNVTEVNAFDTDIYIKGKLLPADGGNEFQINLHINERKNEDANTL